MIENLIFTRLSTFAGLIPLVGDRIYPNIAPANATMPFVVFRKISEETPPAMGSDSGVVRPRFQFSAFAEDFDAARDVRDQLRAALKRWRDPVGPPVVQATFFVSEIDLYEPDGRTQHLATDYEVNYRE